MPKLPEFREAEDGTDAYLTRFEQHLVIFSLLMNDYSKLKQALLAKLLLTAVDFGDSFTNANGGR